MGGKYLLRTLGCKVNQYETEYVREGLLGIGYRDASAEESADLCVVNTCTVTKEGDAKSRQLIRRLQDLTLIETRCRDGSCYRRLTPQDPALVGLLQLVSAALTELLRTPAIVRQPSLLAGTRAYPLLC